MVNSLPPTVYIRTAYDGLDNDHSIANTLDNFEPTLTHQSFKDECDINLIVSSADQSGFLNDSGRPQPQYLDLSDVPTDYQDSLNRVIAAQDAFDALPALVRRRFHNDPAEFVEFASDASNLDDMVKLGLAEMRPLHVETSDDRQGSQADVSTLASKKPKTGVKKPSGDAE